VIVTKTDLCDDEEVQRLDKLLSAMCPSARRLRAVLPHSLCLCLLCCWLAAALPLQPSPHCPPFCCHPSANPPSTALFSTALLSTAVSLLHYYPCYPGEGQSAPPHSPPGCASGRRPRHARLRAHAWQQVATCHSRHHHWHRHPQHD
jgi:hypothetical protein